MAAIDMLRGRQTATRTLTNKSGGSVAQGDVVVIGDGSNDNAFTTTTTASFNARKVGVAMETIANNAAGLVALGGYVLLVNSNSASLTRDRFLFTHTVAKTCTASATRAAGAFGQVLETGTNPEAIIFDALPDPTATAGDNPVVWTAGTSMPGSPATNQRITRTDLAMDFYYNGTRWLAPVDAPLEKLIPTADAGTMPYSATGTYWRGDIPYKDVYDLWLIEWEGWFFVNGGTALSASHKWVLTFTKQPSGGVLGTFNIDSGASSAYRKTGAIAIGALLGTTNYQVDILATKTGTPGTLYGGFSYRYRVVGT